jgi:nitrite reductase/ring-hydroxylating ferredoxin subunit
MTAKTIPIVPVPAVPQGRFEGHARSGVPAPEALLAETNRGTPAGEYLRRFWQPVSMASRVGDRPLAIRIMGEDLVLFRDGSGKLGLLHKHCSHRGASLEFGVICHDGLQCCYHGWKYATDGRLLETPGLCAAAGLDERIGERVSERIRHGAYPVVEYAGLIFAYMGPPEHQPPFPVFDAFVAPQGNEMEPYQLHFPCNWLQVHENGADPMHVPFVHAIISEVQFTRMFGAIPVVDNVETPMGFLSLATRRWGDNLYVRANDVILPNMAQFGTPFIKGEDEKFAVCAGITRWVVPIDDENNWTFGIRHFNPVIDPLNEGRRDLIGYLKTDGFGQTGDRPYEDRQRNPGDWDAQMSQRPIAVHAAENLVAHDSGVVLLRRQLRSAINTVMRGENPAAPRIYPQSQIVPTYVAEIVRAVADQGEADVEAARAFGRQVAMILVETAELPPVERSHEVERRVRDIDVTESVV